MAPATSAPPKQVSVAVSLWRVCPSTVQWFVLTCDFSCLMGLVKVIIFQFVQVFSSEDESEDIQFLHLLQLKLVLFSFFFR